MRLGWGLGVVRGSRQGHREAPRVWSPPHPAEWSRPEHGEWVGGGWEGGGVGWGGGVQARPP